jgi:hypothetical protein
LKIKHLNIVIILFLTCFFYPLSIAAQNKKKSKNPKAEAYTRSRTALEPMPIHLSAMGTFNFYGVKLGVDYPFKMTEIRGFKGTSMGQRVMRELYISADAGLWHYDGVHENVSFSLEWTMRFINSRGFFAQITPIGVGANYILKPFTPQKFIKDSVPTIGKFYGTPSVSVGIGRDFAFQRGNKAIPMVIYMKGGVSSILPFKTYGYLFPTAELSVAWRFRGINAFVRKVRKD